ncbi:MarR family transcriptional regulator [Peribacillus psychrosaccharolyticus]|uniref:MarR family transcriptional regulator n=1 Tax=Peribacillus psychrosaccharolyticus TaxID=1407 RepID=UPI003D27C01B
MDLYREGNLRQQELQPMDLDKSRLSHHLTRMEKRGLVIREQVKIERGVQVFITSTKLNKVVL